MITGQIKNQIDQIWETFWTGGITNSITLLEQMTYLLFMKMLDDAQIRQENKASALGTHVSEPMFNYGSWHNPVTDKDVPMADMRWSKFRNFASECEKNLLLEDKEHRHRNRKGKLSHSEIMTILVCYHFGSFANFKHYYLFYIRHHLSGCFPDAVSYNRFVELMPRVFFHMMLFMKLQGFGKCSGISFVDSTMIPVCHNLRRYANKVFKGLATDGKGTMGWCHGFKLHLLCNDSGEIITFCLTGANVDDRDKRVWTIFAKELYGKVFADRGYIKQTLFEDLFDRGIHLVHGLRANMKNRLMSMWDKIMLRKRCIIECINDLLKNKANIVHSRHRSIHNFIMNICAALTAYSFFENKPEALPVHVEKSRQLSLF